MNYVFSSGGGVQSTACLVLAAQGRIPYQTFVFANVGDKAESPDTMRYVEQITKPFAVKHGIKWVEVHKTNRKGEKVDLYEDCMTNEKQIALPLHYQNGGLGFRCCTTQWKILPIAKWIRHNAPGCVLGVGISTDEPHRAKPAKDGDGYTKAYPLIELNIDRSMCLEIVKEAGLPQPPKSSCWFCPYHTTEAWTHRKRERPELFEKAVKLEETLCKRSLAMGKDPGYLTRHGRPLESCIPNQLGLFPEWIDEQDGCESGYCMT
jgi:hypothetical protein|tara:strand:- start:181 stop:969 length:789 start_codon:yes stop_codon:yes gene_type:complete